MRGLDLCIAKTLQTRFIVVSDDLAKTYQRKISHRKLVVIKNGVDVANLEKAYDRRPTMHDDRAYRILFVGRLVPVKRVDLLLEAAALLGQRGGMQIQIDIYGEGPEAVDLVKKSVALGLATQVSFCGFSENVADELCRADLLVMTSDHEGLPMVLLEALFLRVPVVAPAVGGIPEVLQPRFGELVYDQEPAAYAEAISKCIDRRAELKTNLELAPVLIRQKHSTETQANAYADMYRQLIS
jgi:glycosyltransferase involved in cell wall biosynthesis